jgi:hypothetical protein
MDAYRTTQLLRRWSALNLGDSREETFRHIAASRGGKHGYLDAVEIIVEGSVTQSQATAALPKEVIWGILNRITLEGNRHYWLSNVRGEAVFQQNVYDSIIKENNTDDWQDADIVNDTNPHTFRQSYLIPMSPKNYMPGTTKKGLKDGAFPLAGMRDQGRFSFDIDSVLQTDWALTDQTTISVTVLLHTYYTSDVLLSAPWRMDSFITADSEAQFPGVFGKCNSLWVCDDEFGAYTLPAGNFKLTVDGLVLQDDLRGAEAVSVANMSINDGFDDIVDNRMLPVIHPAKSSSFGDFPGGTVFKITDANTQQSTLRYNIRRFLPLDPEQVQVYTAAMGVKFNPKTDQSRLTINRLPAGQLGLDADRIAGWTVRIRT